MKKVILSVSAVCLAFAISASAGDDDAQKKLDQLRKELGEIQKKEKELQQKGKELRDKIVEMERVARVKEQERRAREEADRVVREEADKKNHHAKIELRGRLTHIPTQQPQMLPERWFVSANEVAWPLNFGNKREVLASAQKALGQAVLVKGSISTKKQIPWANYQRIPPDRWWPGTGQPIQDVPWNQFPVAPGLPTVDVESIEVVDITGKK
jgi:hypothetical protein